MRSGMVKASVMDRSVRRQLHSVMAEEAWHDGSRAFVQSIHTVEGQLFAARRTIWGAAGKVIASGGIPESLSFSILLPEEAEEKDLKRLTKDIQEECSLWNLSVDTCQASVSAHIGDMLVTASCLGEKTPGLGEKISGMTLDLLVAGPVALEGTALIACRERERLLTRYPAFFIDEAVRFYNPEVYKVVEELMTGNENSAFSDSDSYRDSAADLQCRPFQCHYLGEGGIFAGLWEYAAAAGVGLEIELSRIPIRQHTIEVCEFFDRNPYQLFSGGSMLIACPNGGRLAEIFRKRGLDARVIGHTTDGNDRIIRYDEEIRYLEPPKIDEYYKIFTS